jgi:hypothetical protein
MAKEAGPDISFIRDEIKNAIDRIRAKQKDFSGQDDVRKALSSAVDALQATSDKIQQEWCLITWFFMLR